MSGVIMTPAKQNYNVWLYSERQTEQGLQAKGYRTNPLNYRANILFLSNQANPTI